MNRTTGKVKHSGLSALSPMQGRSLLTLEEFDAREVGDLIAHAIALKTQKRAREFSYGLRNRNFALLFLKPSTRTRASFLVAAADEGAHAELFDASEIRFGSKESVKDIARVIGRLFDGIAFRGFEHRTVEEIAKHAGVPVWNALSDEHHPTQVLADLMTLREEFGTLQGMKMAFVGDGRNNMGNSLMIAAGRVGMDLRIVAPRPLQPSQAAVEHYRAAALDPATKLSVTSDIKAGVRDCHAVYGDIWLSMGEEHLVGERVPMLKGFKITDEVLDATGRSDSIFLHCLPSLHDTETEFAKANPEVLDTSDELFEGPRSRVLDQAENRMHVIKALMLATV